MNRPDPETPAIGKQDDEPRPLSAILAAMALDELAAEGATRGPYTVSADEPGDVVIYGAAENWLANVGNWARQNPEQDAERSARQCVEVRDAADAMNYARNSDPSRVTERARDTRALVALCGRLAEALRQAHGEVLTFTGVDKCADGCPVRELLAEFDALAATVPA